MLAIFNQQEALKTKIEFCCDARGTAVVPMCMHSSPVRGRGARNFQERGCATGTLARKLRIDTTTEN